MGTDPAQDPNVSESSDESDKFAEDDNEECSKAKRLSDFEYHKSKAYDDEMADLFELYNRVEVRSLWQLSHGAVEVRRSKVSKAKQKSVKRYF